MRKLRNKSGVVNLDEVEEMVLAREVQVVEIMTRGSVGRWVVSMRTSAPLRTYIGFGRSLATALMDAMRQNKEVK